MSLRGRFKRTLVLLGCAARYWYADNASTTGAALAFYRAFSIAPLLVILLTLAGLIVSETTLYAQVGSQLAALFGPATAKTLLGAVKSAEHQEGAVATAISVVTLAIGATTPLGRQPVPGLLDSGFGLRRGLVLRRAALVALLHFPDFSVRCRIYCLLRWRAQGGTLARSGPRAGRAWP